MELLVGVLVVAAVVFVVWAIVKKACLFGGIAALLIAGAAVLFLVLR